MAKQLNPQILAELPPAPLDNNLSPIEPALPGPGTGSDISLSFNLVDYLLAANRQSPLLEDDCKAAASGD